MNKTAATPMNSTTTNIDEAWKATSLSADELIEIVDENNNVVHPPTTRREMRAKKLPHRATYAFVRDNNNYFYVQKRSMIKDYCPGYFDPTPEVWWLRARAMPQPILGSARRKWVFITPLWSTCSHFTTRTTGNAL